MKMDGILKGTKEITEKLSNIEMEQKQLKEETETENKRFRAEIHTLEIRCRKMKDEHRKKNLIVSGIDISLTKSEIENFKLAGLKLGLSHDFLNSVKIDETIRMKKTVSGKPRDVIIEFLYLSDKLLVLKAARNAKLKDLYIREDFSLATRNITKNLVNPLMNARKMNWRLEGSEFHAFWPAYEKARSPNLSFSLGVSYQKLLEERSLSRPGRSAVAVIMSARYAGLRPMCTWCISTHSLYCMRSLIGSQCRLLRTGVM